MSGSLHPFGTSVFGSYVALLESVVEEEESDAPATPEFYVDLRDGFVKDLLEEFNTGTIVLLRMTEVATDDPLQPFTPSEEELPRDAVVFGFSSERVDGSRILADDLEVYLGADELSFRPAVTDFLRIDGVRHSIVRVKTIPAAGTAVAFVIQARIAGG